MTAIFDSPAETLGEHIDRLTAIESDADTVHAWQPLLIPGALQVFAYACGAIRSTTPALPTETIGERAAIRRRRIDQLRGTSVFILDESILYRPVGGPAALIGQLEHLLAVEALQPSLTLRILPQGVAAHPGLGGPFTMYRAAGQRAVFVESLTSSEITTRPDDVAAYASAWERLEALALPAAESLDLIDATRGTLCRRITTSR